jgi:hypothetical protein
MQHPCEILHSLHGSGFSVGNVHGSCRITGKKSIGQKFSNWVRDTFTDIGNLHPGEIISNEAAFCFDESSGLIQRKTGRDKPQRFRTYSHIVENDGTWHCLTKADKVFMIELIRKTPKIVCIAESGQKHIFFKNKPGLWQIEDTVLKPDLDKFNFLHERMMALAHLGFSQDEIKTGKYIPARVVKCGMPAWQGIEQQIKAFRGSQIFNFTAFFMYSIKSDDGANK